MSCEARARHNMLGRYRRLKLLAGGTCACGEPGMPFLPDVFDPQAVIYICRSCWMKNGWRRRWARQGKSPPQPPPPKPKRQFSAEHMARLNEGLRRWKEARKASREAVEAIS